MWKLFRYQAAIFVISAFAFFLGFGVAWHFAPPVGGAMWPYLRVVASIVVGGFTGGLAMFLGIGALSYAMASEMKGEMESEFDEVFNQ